MSTLTSTLGAPVRRSLPDQGTSFAPSASPRPRDVFDDGKNCGAWWTGYNTCHCAGCHETFTGINAFDRHRRAGRCHNPALMKNRDGSSAFAVAEKRYAAWTLTQGADADE